MSLSLYLCESHGTLNNQAFHVHLAPAGETQVGLVDQRRRLQVIDALPGPEGDVLENKG